MSTEFRFKVTTPNFGTQPLHQQSRAFLMKNIEERHSKRSTMFAAQVPVNNWCEIIGEQTIANAILDRITRDAHRLELTSDSLKKTQVKHCFWNN